MTVTSTQDDAVLGAGGSSQASRRGAQNEARMKVLRGVDLLAELDRVWPISRPLKKTG